MATSGSLSSSDYQGRYIKFEWERTSYSVANNTSTIKWTLKGAGTASSSWYNAGNFKVTIAGDSEYSSSTRIKLYNGTEIASGTKTIKHNTDGTKSFSVSIKAGIYTVAVNCTGSKTFTLTTIPRASSISATSAYVENASTITISRASSAFTHTVTWACGSASGTIATKTSSTKLTWTLPTSLYAQIGSTATSKTVTLTCKTFNGSTQIGDAKTCTLSAKTSASRNGPTLSPTVTTMALTQELTGNKTTLIGGISEATIAFNAAAQDSATLKSTKVTNSGKSRTTNGDFTNCTEGEFVFTATDSRGYTTTVTKTLSVVNYIKPTITLKVTIGVDGKATIKASGKFFSGSFGAKTNALNIQFKYKEAGGTYSAWTNFSTASPGTNTWSASHTLTGLDYSKTYYFQAHATDIAGYGATSDEKKVRAYPVWDWGEKNVHIHGDLRIDNNYCLTGKTTDNGKVNMIYTNTANNVVVGGGSYPPANVYLSVADGGNISASNSGTFYSLLGAAKAIATTYTIPCTVTAGSGYSSCRANAYLIGNCLRVDFHATRGTGAGVGNITNETVMTFIIDHGGKIDNLYRVSCCSDTDGGVAAYSVQAAKVDGDDTKHKITVILTATTTALQAISGYCVMPANIQLSKFL